MKFIVPIFVGAIIGYITNWLAIKMLFRPYEKKYIFGIPLPFTPGLIPKEQKRIAKSVGETVGAYLLSEDIIMEHIEKAELDKRIEEGLKDLVGRLRKSNLDLKDLLMYLEIEEYEDFKIKISNKGLSKILEYLKEEKNKDKILNVFYRLVDRIEYKGEVEKFKKLITSYIERLEDSKEIEEILSKFILDKKDELKKEDRKLKEIVEFEKVEKIIDDYSFMLVEVIKDCIDDFTIADRIKTLLNHIIEENMSRAIRMFLAPDIISEKVYKIVEEYIYREDFEEKLKPILSSGMEKLMEYRVSQVLGELDEKISDEKIKEFSGFIVEKIMTEDNKNKIMDRFENEFLIREDLVKNTLKIKIESSYDNLLKDKYISLSIYNFISNNLDNLLKIKISTIINSLDKNYINMILKKIGNLSIYLINTKVPKLLLLFNISKVVEDEINKFEVDFAEEIILDIASKELKAITWLGALLGAIMGIISPLLQMI